MKAIIIGSGLIGVTTAYFLRRQGLEVTVIDRQAGPGLETSFANGALLTPSMAQPWNAPGSWRVLLASLGRSDAAMQLRLRALPALIGWGMTFLRNSRAQAFERNALSNLRLALYSLEELESLRLASGAEYGHTALGTLRIFREGAALDRAAAAELSSCGLRFHRLSREAIVKLEPALAPIGEQLQGGIHYFDDATGDAYRFCVEIAERARKLGVEFRFSVEVSSVEARARRVTAVLSDAERFSADQYIVAAGSYSSVLLRGIGVSLPVQPAKGYSVTFNRSSGQPSLRIPVVDDSLHAVVVPLEGAIRVAGTAEFAGYDRSLPQSRILNLVTLLQQVLPQERLDLATAKAWCGLRPMSADGVPIIGATPFSNLWLNTGHGHLGWTLAAGSARLLADLMSLGAPMLDPAAYALARFNRSGR